MPGTDTTLSLRVEGRGQSVARLPGAAPIVSGDDRTQEFYGGAAYPAGGMSWGAG